MKKFTKKKENQWLKIWKQKGNNLKSSKIDKILNSGGHDTPNGQFNKKNWFKYIKSLFRGIKLNKNSEILEYGCGAGAVLSYWYEKKYRLNGIDYSKTLVSKGKKYFPKINFRVGEISSIDFFDTKFDLIFTHSVFQYFENYQYAKNLISKMLTKLNKKGYICILDVPNKDKEKHFVRSRKEALGIKEYKKKYEKNKHFFYKKSFFKDFAKKNNLSIRIFDHFSTFNENSKFRYNVILKSKL
jgi:cyclopropane fatty-acyl-phospholipid synthase-like methyltransferase